MAQFEDHPPSTDGWLGNPGLFPVGSTEENTRGFQFSGRSLALRIFIASLISVSILFFGASLMSQTLNNAIQAKQRILNLSVSTTVAYVETLHEGTIAQGDSIVESATSYLSQLPKLSDIDLYVYDTQSNLAAQRLASIRTGPQANDLRRIVEREGFFNRISALTARIGARAGPASPDAMLQTLLQEAIEGNAVQRGTNTQNGLFILAEAQPVVTNNQVEAIVIGAVSPGVLEQTLKNQRVGLIIVYFFTLLVGGALSFLVAQTISVPLGDLARAAEIGQKRQIGGQEFDRVLIPDFVHREDAIGRLSMAMSGMINALYDRIDTNEQFAADVVHEIKNPLASMRSALETLRFAKGEAREKLIGVLVEDVQRLDRLVSDISNASRLDAELVGEQTEKFDLCRMLKRIVEFLSVEAADKGIDLIWEEPAKQIFYDGLEERLAQVFVNLLTNAISFCEEGDAIRIWARVRKNRILIAVEDTGPGIPEEALENIFKRFYSQRSIDDFGTHSGLGLSISKQIVEAHGGVIWAENIRRPIEEDTSLKPIGARFVVGLPK